MWHDSVRNRIEELEQDLTQSSLGYAFRHAAKRIPAQIPRGIYHSAAPGTLSVAVAPLADPLLLTTTILAAVGAGVRPVAKSFADDFERVFEQASESKDLAKQDGLHYLHGINSHLDR